MRQTLRCAFAAARVIRLDDEQPRVLALRAGIGLQRHGGVARRRAQHALEIGDDLAIAFRLVGRRKRMELAELRPRHRDHLRRRVELHRARAQRNHRAVERDVAVGEPAQIAQHLRFGVVAVERRMREERRRAAQRLRQRVADARRRASSSAPCGLRRRRTPARSPRRRRASTSRRATGRACARRRGGNSFRCATPRSAIRAVASPVATTIVSKKCAVGTVWPSRSRPALRIAVSRCTRRAIAVKPGGAVVDRVHRRPSPRAGPAPCRCSTSPSRGGCAARASAARGGTPARRWRRR